MDYEKAYKAALKQAKKELAQSGRDSDSARQILRFFPELAESEDERIRKEMIKAISEIEPDKTYLRLSQEEKDAWIAYLEKQKDASKAIEAVERIDKYIDEHLANAHDMKDSNPDKKYYRGWDDALGKMAGILQDVYSDEKQKEQKQEDLPAGFYVTLNGEKYYAKEVRSNGTNIKVVAPKPAEWSKNDTVFLNEITDFFENKTSRLQHDIDMYAHWLKSLPERFSLQPKSEWTEEDEKMVKEALYCVGYTFGSTHPLVAWLKSLRPQSHWKPREQ